MFNFFRKNKSVSTNKQEDEIAKRFERWVQSIKATGYPNNAAAKLAINTLKVCVVESPIKNDKIAKNGYALFDFTYFCYFTFRYAVCQRATQEFVYRYFAFIQKLIPLYFNHLFGISEEKMIRLIISRGEEYERLMSCDNATYEMRCALTQFIEKDMVNEPELNKVLITSFMDNMDLHLTLSNYISETLHKLVNTSSNII